MEAAKHEAMPFQPAGCLYLIYFTYGHHDQAMRHSVKVHNTLPITQI